MKKLRAKKLDNLATKMLQQQEKMEKWKELVERKKVKKKQK